jgi:hypothetical protein
LRRDTDHFRRVGSDHLHGALSRDDAEFDVALVPRVNDELDLFDVERIVRGNVRRHHAHLPRAGCDDAEVERSLDVGRLIDRVARSLKRNHSALQAASIDERIALARPLAA